MNNVIEVVNVTREATWLPWAVQYFFLVALSVCCFALTLPGFVLGRTEWLRAGRLALVGALVCGIAAPVALLADLHQPGRFWHFYAYPNLRSWMAWGAFFIPAYVGGLILYAWAVMRPALATSPCRSALLARSWRIAALGGGASPMLVRALGVFTVVFGLLVLLYTGMEVMVVRARPLWNTPFLPVQFAVTGVVGAFGLVLVLDRLHGPSDRAMAARLLRLLAIAMAAAVTLGAVWLGFGLLRSDPVHAAALASVADAPAWRMTAFWAGLAGLLTIGLTKLPGVAWLAGLVALHTAWMFRWTVFIGGQTVPKTGAGQYEYHLPLGHDGLLGILGTGGLCLFLLIAITSLLPWDRAASGVAASQDDTAARRA